MNPKFVKTDTFSGKILLINHLYVMAVIMYWKKYMGFHDVQLLMLEEIIIGFLFRADLNENCGQLSKKCITVVMKKLWADTNTTMKKEKKEIERGLNSITKATKKGY